MEQVAQPRSTVAGADPPAAPFAERRAGQDSHRLRPPTPRVALLVLAAILVAFVLFLGRDALAPFIVGLLLVYLLDPPVERLKRLGLPRGIAILLVYAAVIFLLAEAISLALPPLIQQIGQFIGDLPQVEKTLIKQLDQVGRAYRALELPPEVRAAIDRSLADLGRSAGSFNPGDLLPVFNSVAGVIASTFGYLIIPVWVFYLLKDRPSLTGSFDRSLPPEWREDVWAVIGVVERVFGQWVRGQIVLGVTVGVMTYLGLLVLNTVVDPIFGRFALLLAIIAALFELLPIIGPILAAVPLVLLAATASGQAIVAALALAFVIQQAENYLLVPKIQGDAVRLHPSAVMFALIVGAAIAGLLGAILSLPITAAARDVYRYLFRRLSPSGSAPPADLAAQVVAGG